MVTIVKNGQKRYKKTVKNGQELSQTINTVNTVHNNDNKGPQLSILSKTVKKSSKQFLKKKCPKLAKTVNNSKKKKQSSMVISVKNGQKWYTKRSKLVKKLS